MLLPLLLLIFAFCQPFSQQLQQQQLPVIHLYGNLAFSRARTLASFPLSPFSPSCKENLCQLVITISIRTCAATEINKPQRGAAMAEAEINATGKYIYYMYIHYIYLQFIAFKACVVCVFIAKWSHLLLTVCCLSCSWYPVRMGYECKRYIMCANRQVVIDQIWINLYITYIYVYKQSKCVCKLYLKEFQMQIEWGKV